MPQDSDHLLIDACTRSLRCELLACGHSQQDGAFERATRRLPQIVVSSIDQGNCTITVEGQKHQLQAGDLMLTHEFQGHSYQSKKGFKESWAYLRLRIYGTVDLVQLLNLPAVFRHKQSNGLRSCLNDMIKQEPTHTINSALHIQSRLRDFLRQLIALAPLDLSNQRLRALLRILPALQFMQDNIKENDSRDALAAEAKLAPSRFHQLFKEALYVSPIAYRNRLRLQEARRLLEGTQQSIQDIAAQVGFEDPFHFSRTFRGTYGMSPRAFRKQALHD